MGSIQPIMDNGRFPVFARRRDNRVKDTGDTREICYKVLLNRYYAQRWIFTDMVAKVLDNLPVLTIDVLAY